MKTSWLILPLAASAAAGLYLQTATPRRAASAAPAAQRAPAPTPSAKYITGERGANHRLLQKVTRATDPSGRIVMRTNTAFVELATGLNYRDNGEWKEAREEIEAVDGGAMARHGAHKVFFAHNLVSAAAIDLEMPDGNHLRSHIAGLAYRDSASGKSVLIAETRAAEGRIADRNQIVYDNAFTDFKADVRYTYTRGGFEQDVILREAPPTPEAYGFNPATTRLLVLTEFVDPPQPQKRNLHLDQLDGRGLADEELNFGAMRMSRGRAFSIGATPST